MWTLIISAILYGVNAAFAGAKTREDKQARLYDFWNPIFDANEWPASFSYWLWGSNPNRRNVNRAINLTTDLLEGSSAAWDEFISVSSNSLPPRAIVKEYFMEGMPDNLHWENDKCMNGYSTDFNEHIPQSYAQAVLIVEGDRGNSSGTGGSSGGGIRSGGGNTRGGGAQNNGGNSDPREPHTGGTRGGGNGILNTDTQKGRGKSNFGIMDENLNKVLTYLGIGISFYLLLTSKKSKK